jgi:tryptophanyl-tRNA synthetase
MNSCCGSCIRKIHFGDVQGATSFASLPHIFEADESKTPCLIPCAIDQDPYFRMIRDFAARLYFAKPAVIHARFLDALHGSGTEMSASVESSAIIIRDQPNQIYNKIKKYAFSGGQATEAEQRELGGDTDKDASYQFLTFFMEDDDELEKIRKGISQRRNAHGRVKGEVHIRTPSICQRFPGTAVKGYGRFH